MNKIPDENHDDFPSDRREEESKDRREKRLEGNFDWDSVDESVDSAEPFSPEEANLPLASGFARFSSFLKDTVGEDFSPSIAAHALVIYMQGASDVIALISDGAVVRPESGGLNIRGYSIGELRYEADQFLGVSEEEGFDEDDEEERSDEYVGPISDSIRNIVGKFTIGKKN